MRLGPLLASLSVVLAGTLLAAPPVAAEPSAPVLTAPASYADRTTPLSITAAPETPVSVERMLDGTWVSAGSATTDAAGHATLAVAVSRVPARNALRATAGGLTGQYQARAPGDAHLDPGDRPGHRGRRADDPARRRTTHGRGGRGARTGAPAAGGGRCLAHRADPARGRHGGGPHPHHAARGQPLACDQPGTAVGRVVGEPAGSRSTTCRPPVRWCCRARPRSPARCPPRPARPAPAPGR
ncbi:hypothetical protein G5V59_09680 [Nocardioides sp. W3-2-3]|uniref:hypothetical protein n=1 Tax=Nocardioides convexus TaxID=2712224 RepID=UPI00241823D5|nr:hypothetical protein [Nocardioides convexus]NHA00280.1 hypothetical protein [Nocardioides convexus]